MRISPSFVLLGTIFVPLTVGTLACSRPPTASASRPPTDSERIPTVNVGSAQTTLGFASGRGRVTRDLPSFRIAKSPVTLKDFHACVYAGACRAEATEACGGDGSASVLDGPTLAAEARPDLPATCVAPSQARAYCAWQGGRLASVEEWMLAARGPDVHRFAWGDGEPNCQRHPSARGLFATQASCCGEAGCTNETLALIGTHPAGASPSGVEDVLLTPAELVAGSQTFEACSDPSRDCLVRGRGGEIESVERAEARTPTFAFRCVLEAK